MATFNLAYRLLEIFPSTAFAPV